MSTDKSRIYVMGREEGGANNGNSIYRLVVDALDTALGDMDADGSIDFQDLLWFVTALEDEGAYIREFGVLPVVRGDVNGDAVFNLSDVEPFAALVGVPAGAVFAAVPEPAALGVLLGGLPLATRRCRGLG